MATKGIRKPEKALTAKFVESAREPGKSFDRHGLFLRVHPNGALQCVQRITIRGKCSELVVRDARTFAFQLAEVGATVPMVRAFLAAIKLHWEAHDRDPSRNRTKPHRQVCPPC